MQSILTFYHSEIVAFAFFQQLFFFLEKCWVYR